MTNYRIVNRERYANPWVVALAIAAGFLIASVGTVHAKSSYLSSFNSTYGTSGSALNSCSLCHPGGNTKTFNPYATAYAGAGHSFSAIENADSDGDGYANIEEINARTFPGDPASKPATTPPPPPADTTPPTVSSTSPVAGATAVPVSTDVTATFSEAVKSVSTATFTLMAGNTPVAGTVTLSGTTATFNPSASLATATTYTATVTTGVTDLANNVLSPGNKVWTFTTGAAADTTPPTATATNPAAGQTGVAVNADVTATFSEAVKSVSTATFTLMAGNTPVAGTVTLSGTTATFNPSAPLANSTTYTATVTTGVTDLANNALSPGNKVWTFTTGAAADATPPTVTATSPLAGATRAATNTAVTATFGEAVKSVTTATFTLKAGATSVAGTVTLSPDAMTAVFAPAAPLAPSTTYTATVTTGVTDLANNALAADHAWSFTTVPAASDADGDGSPDNHDAFPNDNRKATVPDPMGGQGMTTIDTSGNAGTRLTWADCIADSDGSLNQNGKPAGYAFPHGVVSYVVAGVAPGGTANVVITYPAAIPANARIYKVDSSGFHEFPGAVINGNSVTLPLRDGGAGDADGQANGSIDDPVAVATPLAATTPPDPPASAAESSGGCSMAGTGGGLADAAGAYGFLAAVGLALLGRRARRAGRRPLP